MKDELKVYSDAVTKRKKLQEKAERLRIEMKNVESELSECYMDEQIALRNFQYAVEDDSEASARGV
jgi:hypothetical protein